MDPGHRPKPSGEPGPVLIQLRQAITRRPADPAAFLRLGDRLGDLGRFDEAEKVLASGVALAPQAAVLRVGLGYLRVTSAAPAAARQVFESVLAQEPGRFDALVGLGQALVLLGDHEAAAERFARALDLRPGEAGVRVRLGRCLLRIGGGGTRGEASLRQAVLAGATACGTGEWPPCQPAPSHGRLFLSPRAAAEFLGAD